MHPPFRVSNLTKGAYGLALGSTLVTGVAGFVSALGASRNRADIVDFHVFDLVASLAWSGRLSEAYRFATLFPLEKALSGHDGYMPWSYPPLFALVLAPFAVLPAVLAFVLFVTVTLSLYVLAMRRLGGACAWPVLLAMAPSVMINVRSGQNGLLTAALVAAGATCVLAHKPVRTGLALAALTIKPHLAVMLPLVLVLERRWRALGVAAAAAAALTALSIAVFGTAAFSAFLTSFSEVRQYLAAGAYPLHRMTTVYSFLQSLGVPSPSAIAIHALVAFAVLAWTARVAVGSADLRTRSGLMIMATVFVSPYLYDYDQTIFGVGLVLVAPALTAAMSARSYGLLLLAVAVSQTAGVIANAFHGTVVESCPSLMAPALLGCYAVVVRVAALDRPPAVVEAGPSPPFHRSAA